VAIKTDTNEIQEIMWEYFENLHFNKLENENFLTNVVHYI
jgi:hypothetical protein